MRFLLGLALGACLLITSCSKSSEPAPQATSAKPETPPEKPLPPGVPPDTIVFEAKNGNVTFTHKKHYERVDNKCETCHPKIFPQAREPLNYKKGNHRSAE